MLAQLTQACLRNRDHRPRRHPKLGLGIAVLSLWLAAGNRFVTEGRAQELAPADVIAGEVVEAAAATELPVPAAPGWDRRETLLASLTIFVLSVFLGFELITKVPPTLHTPLMSGSNAISGITLVGAILAVGVTSSGGMIPLLGTLAVIMATVNAVGGFAVTHRMLSMFRRK